MINDEILAIKDTILKDALTNYEEKFKKHSSQPTIERTIAQKGVVLYG
jgi:hypothetical protein